MSTAPSYVLKSLDGADAVTARDVARLHAALLPDSPVVLLGPRFMQRFYYTTLAAEGVVRGAVAYVDDVAAGFIVGSTEATGFMQRALQRHPLRLAGLLGVSVLRDPRRLAALWEAWGIMRGLPAPASPQNGVGEILSFGVLPPFRSPKFVRRYGIKISFDLLQSMLQMLQAGGARTVRAVVDADNLEARLFYQGQGWELGEERVPGWRKPAVEYVWRVPAG